MPEDQKTLKCACKECGTHLEFAESMLNSVIACPHCGQWTELTGDAVPGGEQPGDRRTLVMAFSGIGLLAAAILLGFIWWQHSKSVEKPKPANTARIVTQPTNPPPQTALQPTPPPVATEAPAESSIQRTKSLEDLKVGAIELEKTPGTSLVHAVGTVKNDSDFVRYGVKIELALYNKDGKKIGVTQDYQSTIEPHQEWRFKALVTDPRTTAAKLVGLTEEQ